MSASSTILNTQALAEFVPKGKRMDIVKAYEKARLKGIAYVKNRINDEQEVQREIRSNYIDGTKDESKEIYAMINEVRDRYNNEIEQLTNDVNSIKDKLSCIEKVTELNCYDIARLKTKQGFKA